MAYMKRKEVLEITGLSGKALFMLVDRGRFPKPAGYWGRALVWEERDIHNWLLELRFRREDQEATPAGYPLGSSPSDMRPE